MPFLKNIFCWAAAKNNPTKITAVSWLSPPALFSCCSYWQPRPNLAVRKQVPLLALSASLFLSFPFLWNNLFFPFSGGMSHPKRQLHSDIDIRCHHNGGHQWCDTSAIRKLFRTCSHSQRIPDPHVRWSSYFDNKIWCLWTWHSYGDLKDERRSRSYFSEQRALVDSGSRRHDES